MNWRLKDLVAEVESREVVFRNARTVKRAVESIQPEWIFHTAAHWGSSFQTDIQQILEN